MLLAGDEFGNSQHGNNNAYCQDSEISWLDWSWDDDGRALLDFTTRLIALWREQPALKQRRFFHGRSIRGEAAKFIHWFDPAGQEMSNEEWNAGYARCLGVVLSGEALDVNQFGETISGDTLLILYNADHSMKIDFTLPTIDDGADWELQLETFHPAWQGEKQFKPGSSFPLEACSVAVLKLSRSADKKV